MGKHYNNSQCFKKKNNKVKLLIGIILEKNNKTNTKKREKIILETL